MIRLPLNSSRDLPSQFTSALEGRRINLQAGNTHPYTALAVSWRNVSESATELVNQLRRLQAAPPFSEHFKPVPILKALKTLIYDATETFDLYQQTIPDLLMSGRSKSEVAAIKEYKAVIKRLRDPIALMCNLMKHEHREIVSARIVSQATGRVTFVYRINAVYHGTQQADAKIHRDGGFASIERTLHEIVHGLLRADHNAGKLVRQLSEAHAQEIELKGISSLGLAKILDDLSSHIPIVAKSESNRFDGVRVEGENVLLDHLVADQVPEPTTRTMLITVDEVAPSVQLIN